MAALGTTRHDMSRMQRIAVCSARKSMAARPRSFLTEVYRQVSCRKGACALSGILGIWNKIADKRDALSAMTTDDAARFRDSGRPLLSKMIPA
jgi:hypothetical protein